jgi:hypothetical protein
MSAPNSATRFVICSRVISTFRSVMAFHIKLEVCPPDIYGCAVHGGFSWGLEAFL